MIIISNLKSNGLVLNSEEEDKSARN